MAIVHVIVDSNRLLEAVSHNVSSLNTVFNWIKGNYPFFKEHNMSLLPNYILAKKQQTLKV